jgi:hypothetical protein
MTATDRLIRVAAAVAVLVVAGIAAVISYGHAYELVRTHGETGATARALPLTVDGLIVTCSLVLLDSARRRQRAPALAWWLLACGILATLGANIAHGLAHGVVGAVIAGWPALVAVGSFEMLSRLIRGTRTDRAGTDESTVSNDVNADILTHLTAPAASNGRVRAPAVPDPHLDRARQVFAEELARGVVPSIRKIKEALRIGQPRARQVHAHLTALAAPGST